MTYTIEVVPFSEYDWTFEKPGWLNLNPAAVALIATFCGIAYWMSLELLVLAHLTFKRRTGLYFWSIVVTTVGVVLQTTGYLLKAFENPWPAVLVTIVCKVGWVSNVTGFSLVLWARLHLVVRDPQVLRMVLAMIVLDAVVLHTPIVVFEFCFLSPTHRGTFLYPMEVMERIQQTVFTLQECVIAGLYIYHTARFLGSGFGERTRRVVALLIAVQVIAICFDAALTAFDYMNMFTLKCTVHPFVYSVKLKLEFIVLNQLLGIVKKGLTPGLREGNLSDLVGGLRSDGKGNSSVSFGTKAPVVTGSRAVDPGADAVDGAQELTDEECLVDVIGHPDSEVTDSSSEENVKVTNADERYVVDDVERQYLGNFRPRI